MTVYAAPGAAGAKIAYKARYDNFIGGRFVPALHCRGYRQGAGRCPCRRRCLGPYVGAGALADPAEDRRPHRGQPGAAGHAETWDNGKAVRETLNADIPLAADHFRYFAGLRARPGRQRRRDRRNTVAYHIHEPLGVVGQIIPWNFPLLMAAWKLAHRPWAQATAWCSNRPSQRRSASAS
jgi:aldehyde dehydrogenase